MRKKATWSLKQEKEEHFIMEMDGCQHTKKDVTDCCENIGDCEECGKPMHAQGCYGYMLYCCESHIDECENGGVVDYE